MSWMDLDPVASRNIMDQAVLNPIRPQDPSWFAGAWKAPFTGLASAVNDVALLTGDAVTPPLRSLARPVDDLFGTNVDDWLVKEQQKAVDNIKGWAPDPQTTGMVGQAVHGLFNVVPEAIGGPETAAVLQGYKGYRRGMSEGLDPTTALGVGTFDAVSTWAGMKLPMQVLPRYGIAGALATGAGGNVGVGMLSRGATSQWLDANGYSDMASQYRVLDSSAIFTDLVLGGGFGALAHYGPAVGQRYADWRNGVGRDVPPSAIDAAHLLNSQLHVETDLAPGIPADTATRAAHVQAVNDALAALAKDEPVNVRPEVTQGNFIDNPQAAESRAQAAQIIEDYLGPEWRGLKAELEARGMALDEIDQSGAVRVQPVAARDIGAALGERIKGDFEGAVNEYGRLEDSSGGRILNTDIARELSPEYRANRTRSADVHEAASQFIKDLYARNLKGPTPEGRDATVLFTGGGTGAGKSTGLKLLGGLADRAEMIYDTNMNSLKSAQTKIEQALQANRKVTIVYTFRDPVEALSQGSLSRAARMERDLGTGRTVPLQEHIKTHVGARDVIGRLAEHYAGDERVQIIAIDNSRGRGNAAVVPVAELPTIEHNGLEAKLHEAASSEFQAGRISEAVYRSSTGRDVARGVVEAGGRGDRGQSEPAGQGRSEADLIDFTASGGAPDLRGAAARAVPDDIAHVLDERSDLVIPDQNGHPVQAGEALARADAEIASAERESLGFEAAAACVLRG